GYAGVYIDATGQEAGLGNHPPGESFLAYTLAAALRAGISLNSHWRWTPHEQIGRANDPIRDVNICASNPSGQACSLLESSTMSLKVPFYDVTLSITPRRVLEMARDAGINSMWAEDRKRVDLRRADVGALSPARFDITLGIGEYPVTVVDQANAMA